MERLVVEQSGRCVQCHSEAKAYRIICSFSAGVRSGLSMSSHSMLKQWAGKNCGLWRGQSRTWLARRLTGFGRVFKKIHLPGFNGVFGTEDLKAVVLHEVLEDGRAVAKLIHRGSDIGEQGVVQ